jgi:hemerythrin-like domain-containing protein
MDLIESLGEEHRLLGRLLTSFEAYLGVMEKGSDPLELFRFVLVLSDYADAWHHEKEEHLLFPALARGRYAMDSGILQHVRDEHVEERILFAKLRRAVARRDHSLAGVEDTARTLIEFQRAHMKKEWELLFRDARGDLANDETRVAKDLERFERAHDYAGHHEWVTGLAQDLIDRHTPAR